MYRSRKVNLSYRPEKKMRSLLGGKLGCPFCEDMGDRVINKTKYNSIVKNIFAYQYWELMKVTDHLMIVPLRHVKSFGDLDDNEKIDTINLISKYESLGYNVYAREKNNKIKSVPHQHTHLIKTDNKRAHFFFYLKRPYLIFRA